MSTTGGPVSQRCAAVAFYGIQASARAVECVYREIIRWYAELGYPADRMGLIGPGHSGKVISFSRCAGKLKKTGFEGVTAIEIASMVPGWTYWREYLLTAKYIQTEDGAVFYVVARDSIATLSHDSLLPVVRTLVEPLRPAYGTGFTCDHELGPHAYVFGVNEGGLKETVADHERKRRVSFWVFGMENKVWSQGLLRDVYAWNFLTQPHLERQVGGRSLAEWTRQDGTRGTLIPVGGGVTLWEVHSPGLEEAQNALWDAGALHRARSQVDSTYKGSLR